MTDALLAPFVLVLQKVVGWLPSGTAVDMGPLDTVWTAVRQFDSLVPVMGPLVFMLGLLSVLGVFVLIRVVLTVWKLIWP